ncbi:FAD-dependent oxidoreductase [Legionella quateirensis]|uniref:Kynurenine 3-monooxygenase n=1 Tax=Legionella quateirensis TaxID=45072 RepID=A0A378KSG8_9GAMM|nr:hypothetical protein [Legionella quateirensis]KTD50940.1 Kynurenine 3-monooxygenase [Legionella quateirensis]STY17814.1 ubiquinone biosynthesis hydroxylase, UbiH/UbiF/VisC/COQ6 family [Legionella quateirensis]
MSGTNTPSDTNRTYDVVICGAGPIGLIAAFELLRNRHKILIIEKRSKEESTSRQQMILLTEVTRIQLLNCIHTRDKLDDNDFKFLEGLGSSKVVSISRLQRFLLNRLHHLNNTINRNSSPNPIIEYKTRIKSASLPEGTATLISHDQEIDIQFGHLIGADGANCESLEKINFGDIRKPVRKSVSKLSYLKNTFHLGVYAICKRIDGLPFEIPDEEFIRGHSSHKLLYFLRVDKASHKKSGGTCVKVGFVGEIPKKIFLQHQREHQEFNQAGIDNQSIDLKYYTALNFVKKIFAKSLKLRKTDVILELKTSKNTKKNSTRVLAFKGRSIKADTAAVRANTHGFYLIGDAYFSPNYPIGHGLNDGAFAASYLGCIKKSTEASVNYLDKHIHQYNQMTNNLAQIAIDIMKQLYWIDAFRQKWLIRRLLTPEFTIKDNGSYLMIRDQYDNKLNSESVLRLGYNSIDLQILNYINIKFNQYIACFPNEDETKINDLMILFMKLNSTIINQYRIEIKHILRKLQDKNPEIDLGAANKYIERIIKLTRKRILAKAAYLLKKEKNTDELFQSDTFSDPVIVRELLSKEINPFKNNKHSVIKTIHNRKSIYILLAIEYLMYLYEDNLSKSNADSDLIDELVTIIQDITREREAFKLYTYIFDIDYLNQILKKLDPNHHILSNWELAFTSLRNHIAILKKVNRFDEDIISTISSSDSFSEYNDYLEAAQYGNLHKLKDIESTLSDPSKIESYLQNRRYLVYKMAIQNGHINVIQHFYEISSENFKKAIQSDDYTLLNAALYIKSNEIIKFIFTISDDKPNDIIKKNSYKLFLSAIELNNEVLFVYLSKYVDSYDLAKMLTEHRLLYSALKSNDIKAIDCICSMVNNSVDHQYLSTLLNDKIILSARLLINSTHMFITNITTLVHLLKLLNSTSYTSPNIRELLSFAQESSIGGKAYEDRVHFVVSVLSGIEEVSRLFSGKDRNELKSYFKYAACGGFDYVIAYIMQNQLLDISSVITERKYNLLMLVILNKKLNTLKILLNQIPNRIPSFLEARDYKVFILASDIEDISIYNYLLIIAMEHHVSIDAIIESHDYKIIDNLIYHKNIHQLNQMISMSASTYNKMLIQKKLMESNLSLILDDFTQDPHIDTKSVDTVNEITDPFELFMKYIKDRDIRSLYHFLNREDQIPVAIINLLEFNDYEGFKTALSTREPDLILILFEKASRYDIATQMLLSIIDQYKESNLAHKIDDMFILEPIQEWAMSKYELFKEYFVKDESSQTRYSFFIKTVHSQHTDDESFAPTHEGKGKPNR